MRLKSIELGGFKSFAQKTVFVFDSAITAIVGPNGSGKSNAAEAVRWVLGERSLRLLRGRRGEDLIWHGGKQSGRSGRGGAVIVFDNRDRRFNLDFDEVVLKREVFRDGVNNYYLNGAAVRHRDVLEVLASAGLGLSSHYIIHQGEADHFLLADAGERRQMVEGALGLRLYQWKISISEEKLKKTEVNILQAESLRREIVPRLRFLKKQMAKIEERERYLKELRRAAADFFSAERTYLAGQRKTLGAEGRSLAEELSLAESRRTVLLKAFGGKGEISEAAFRQLEEELKEILAVKEDLSRRLGRLEGKLESLTRQPRRWRDWPTQFSFAEAESLAVRIKEEIDRAEVAEDLGFVRQALSKIRTLLGKFFSLAQQQPAGEDQAKENLEKEKLALATEMEKLTVRERELNKELVRRREEAVKEREKQDGAQREAFSLEAKRRELEMKLQSLEIRVRDLAAAEERLKREISQTETILGEGLSFAGEVDPALVQNGKCREESRRQIERLKFRLEDSGEVGSDLTKEHQEVADRDGFLAREIADLRQSAGDLRQVIKELRQKIEEEFKEGVIKINRHFEEFFSLMFGGGSASLRAAKEKSLPAEYQEEEIGPPAGDAPPEAKELEAMSATAGRQAGLDIVVSLPRKKIKGLEMLSGGERALVSVALLFAMSQVNPPPFLILDEIDAALDEANSRRYGDLLENLAARSQLILITHNRETMSRAGAIYGVTMGDDGVSRLLSIKFDEAVGFAQ